MLIYLNTAAEVMGCRSHRNIFFGDVDTQSFTMLVDVREVLFRGLRILVGNIKVDMLVATVFHLVVNRPRDDVAWGERLTRVVAFHEFFPVEGTQDGPVAAHGFRDQK